MGKYRYEAAGFKKEKVYVDSHYTAPLTNEDLYYNIDLLKLGTSSNKIGFFGSNGSSKISVSDFSTLQIGDVIRLDRGAEEALDVYVGNIKKFKALPGSSNDKFAVRVTTVIREE